MLRAMSVALGVVVLGPAGAARADGPCVVRTEGAFLANVDVEISGATPITLDVNGSRSVSVDVPSRTEPLTRSHVESSLTFDGRARVRDLPWRWGPSGASIGRVLDVQHGGDWEIVRAWSPGASVHVTLAMTDVRIEDAVVSCEALTLASARPAPSPNRAGASPESGGLWAPTVRALRVRADRRDTASVTLVLARPERFEVGIVREEAGSALVRRNGYGYVLEGWVARRELRRVVAVGRGGFSGRSARAGGRVCEPPFEPDVWVGPGAVALGTSVFDRPDGTAWATVSTSQALLVSHRDRSDWVALLDAPGLRFGPTWCAAPRAWVRASAVALGVDHAASIPLGRPPPSSSTIRISPRPMRRAPRAPAP